jgi:hypothetical protein
VISFGCVVTDSDEGKSFRTGIQSLNDELGSVDCNNSSFLLDEQEANKTKQKRLNKHSFFIVISLYKFELTIK